jgi:hypothetical protein
MNSDRQLRIGHFTLSRYKADSEDGARQRSVI